MLNLSPTRVARSHEGKAHPLRRELPVQEEGEAQQVHLTSWLAAIIVGWQIAIQLKVR